jgi:LysR family glycine cleavage system transcriptional activator
MKQRRMPRRSLSVLRRRKLPLNALRAFEAVAIHGGFTAAANALCISQSSLSRHVMSLEGFIGEQLFYRTANLVSLTARGERLLLVTQQLFDNLLEVVDEIRGGKQVPDARTLRATYWETEK